MSNTLTNLKSKCETKYSEDDKIRREDILQLEEWAKKQSHLPKISEYLLIMFYQVCDYSPQYAQKLIETHYDFRNVACEFFPGKTYSNFFDICYSFSSPYKTPEGYSIHYLGFKDNDSSKFLCYEFALTQIRIIHSYILNEGNGTGIIYVWDANGLTLRHLTKISISLLGKVIHYNQEAIPANLRYLYFIGTNPVTNKLWALFRRFMNKKLVEKVNIISDMSTLYKFIPKNCLPVELGGTLPLSKDNLQEITKTQLEATEKLIDEEFSLKTDRSKRTGHKSGSFKKFEID